MTLDKIIFRNNDSYLKMYKGSELISEVNSEPALDYLTFTALKAGSSVKFSRSGVTSEYSTDNGSTWTSGDNVTVTLSNVGDKVKYRGVTSTTSSSNNKKAFTLTGQIKASGSVMSMINNNPNDTNLSELTYAFAFYFYGQRYLKDISELKLPATTLSDYCYRDMFNSCHGLTTVPYNLPATTLPEYCYYRMFVNCSKITTAPELPSTTLETHCYHSMFEDCISLTTAPELPATTLETNCYQSMFSNCTSLTTAPELPATTLKTSCYQSMFSSCTSLTTAPELPATTLETWCYDYMFSNCTNLNRVVIYVQNIPSNMAALSNWLANVAETGDFYNLGGASYSSGVNGIPEGWTVHTTLD